MFSIFLDMSRQSDWRLWSNINKTSCSVQLFFLCVCKPTLYPSLCSPFSSVTLPPFPCPPPPALFLSLPPLCLHLFPKLLPPPFPPLVDQPPFIPFSPCFPTLFSPFPILLSSERKKELMIFNHFLVLIQWQSIIDSS